MYRGEIDTPADKSWPPPGAGQDLFGSEPQAAGTVISAAPRPEGGFELLAVMQSAVVEGGGPLRLGSPDGPLVRIAPLPYPV